MAWIDEAEYFTGLSNFLFWSYRFEGIPQLWKRYLKILFSAKTIEYFYILITYEKVLYLWIIWPLLFLRNVH